jgi:thymidylate synthase (FAD)
MDENVESLYESVGDPIGHIRLIDHMGDDLRVVNAARVSFGRHSESFTDSDDLLLRYLLRNGHTSPLEHCVITWLFKVPLFVRSQHMRHRTWSFNEVSRRYTSEVVDFYLPTSFRKQHPSNRQASTSEHTDPLVEYHWEKQSAHKAVRAAMRDALALYEDMMVAGVAREMARMVLPQSLYTSYYGTIDLHNALRFIKVRSDEHAQWEIRRVAEAMHKQLRGLFPKVMQAWEDIP